MASSIHCIALCSLLFISSALVSQAQLKPKKLLLPVTKDTKTLQYLTKINQRTPFVSLSLVVDLGGPHLWTDCYGHRNISSTYKFYHCHSSQCEKLQPETMCNTCFSDSGPNCHNDSCAVFSRNPISTKGTSGALSTDVVSIQSTDGKNPKHVVKIPKFFFVCVDNTMSYNLSSGLAKGVNGLVGFGRSKISLPFQSAKFFDFPNIFGVCLSSKKGVIFLGDRPYVFPPNIDVASFLTYTPLQTGEGARNPNSEYYIGLKSIKINGNVVPINTTLLSIGKYGGGGTTISTANPYTLLEPSIYDAFVNAFTKAISHAKRVAPVPPFQVCYNSKDIKSTRLGPSVPVIELGLQSHTVFEEEVNWSIYGANSMVQVKEDVLCLGFLKIGDDIYAPPAITIGGHQLEDNFLQFNVDKYLLGFSSSLLSRQTTCSNWDFTTSLHEKTSFFTSI